VWRRPGPSRWEPISAGTELAAVVLTALAAPRDPGLDLLLGPDTARSVREALAARARRWAAQAAPDRAYEATTSGAAQAALVDHAGPVALVAPDIPGLDQRLVADALDDLAHGCDLALGSAHDGRPYLAVVRELRPDLLELVEMSFDAGMLTGFAGRDVTFGMLRNERRLAGAGDAHALAIDPRAPAELRALVTRGLGPAAAR
jgi:Uncharacterized protein conserved in bacteria (DUF2064)